jgi:hypothetical protein
LELYTPTLPCLPAGRLYKKEEFPLFEKEGLGEIFRTISLLNYGLLSKATLYQ